MAFWHGDSNEVLVAQGSRCVQRLKRFGETAYPGAYYQPQHAAGVPTSIAVRTYTITLSLTNMIPTVEMSAVFAVRLRRVLGVLRERRRRVSSRESCFVLNRLAHLSYIGCLVGCLVGWLVWANRLFSVKVSEPLLHWSNACSSAALHINWMSPSRFCILDADSYLYVWDLARDLVVSG